MTFEAWTPVSPLPPDHSAVPGNPLQHNSFRFTPPRLTGAHALHQPPAATG